jgi:hypothetical protein
MNVGEGDYVRTKGGVICKVLSVRPQSKYMCNSGHYSVSPERYVLDNKKIISLSKPYIKKSSPNIIDLIEVRRLCKWLFN